MVALRVSAPWLIVIISCVILGNCELEEYFKWKQITFSSLQRDGDEVTFPGIHTPMLNQGFPMHNQGFPMPNHGYPMPNQGYPMHNHGYPTHNQANQNNPIYIPTNNVPMGATHHKGKIIIGIPRRRTGVPSTLNFIYTKSTKGSSPSLKAFPNDEMNALHPNLQPDPNRIISVYRTRVDECNRLWFVDTGMLEYPGNMTQVQRPSIWVYDLENDRVVHRFEIPESIVAQGTGMASLTIDVNLNNCQDAYAYVPDLVNNALYVYSLRRNHMWAFRHNYFRLDPLHGDFHVAGVDYQWDDGIFSITLGPRQPDGFRTVFFHPMVSVSEFAVSSRVLQDEQMSSRSYHGSDFMHIGSRGPNTQSAMHDFDPHTGVIFYSQVGTNALGCWNTKSPHSPQNFGILAKDDRTMIYPTDVNVDSDGVLWMLTNTMPRFIYAQLDWNEYNFRIWRASTTELIQNSVCRGY